jgi:hypothetical protein
MARRPWQSNEERLVDEALEAQLVPGELLAELGPPLPQIDPFPPRMGYGSAAERTPTIMDAINTDRYYPDRRVDFSGGPGSYSGTSRSSG